MRSKFNSLKARAKKNNLPVTMSFELYKELKRDDCYYCGVSNMLLQFYCEVMGLKTPWMTIDRADNSLGYIFNNVVPCCFLCNKIKGSFFSSQEMKLIGKQFIAPKLKSFEKEAFEAFSEWCENNVFDDEDLNQYEDVDI
jgi:hypothetical protein